MKKKSLETCVYVPGRIIFVIQNIQKILLGLGQRGCLRQYNSFDKVFNPKEQRNIVTIKEL